MTIHPVRAFIRSQAAGGLALMAAAVLALGLANSPLASGYSALLHDPVGPLNVEGWINDGLMALFFLLVGLEIKREAVEGELSTWRARALPGLAALGGMIAPALVYVAVAARHPQVLAGWAIPAATDIAFALAVLSLLGRRAPLSLKLFLTALAIIDDLGAIVIIALFYTSQLSPLALGGAGLAALGLLALNRLKVRVLWPYLLAGAVLWMLMLQSGVHATLAGVITALFVPAGGEASPLRRLEHGLHPWVAFGVAPLFGLANAGLSFAGLRLGELLAPIPLGVALGLFAGKPVGVFGAVWLAVRLGWADRPAGAGWLQVWGVAILCGIGFTMSLFIGALAFPGAPHLMDQVKAGVLLGSLASALAGAAVLALGVSPKPSA